MQLWPVSQVGIVCFDDGKGLARQLLADAAEYCRIHGLAVETECVTGSPKEYLPAFLSTMLSLRQT